jgi:hypothetical protein
LSAVPTDAAAATFTETASATTLNASVLIMSPSRLSAGVSGFTDRMGKWSAMVRVRKRPDLPAFLRLRERAVLFGGQPG